VSIINAVVVEERPPPWGLWATIGWTLLVLVVHFTAQVMVTMVMTLAAGGEPALGLTVCVAAWISNSLCLAMIAALATAPRGSSLTDCLALKAVRWQRLLRWSAGVVLFAVFLEMAAYCAGRKTVSDFTLQIYTSASWRPLLWSVVLVAAPVFEEVFLRGFAFRGIQASPLGAAGAVVLTSLIWTGMHVQYGWPELQTLLVVGVFLGIARAVTGSVRTTIVMHSVWNLIATLEVWWYLRSGQV
jgi:uncharacterized protein